MSNGTQYPPIPPGITLITGPQVYGELFNWALFGVLTVQLYVYHLNFSNDSIASKLLVYGVYFLEVIQTVLTAADMHYWFVSGYGDINHLGNPFLSPLDTPFLCGIIAGIVQCFFAYRIWKMHRSQWWMSSLIVATAIVQTAGAFGVAFRAHKLGNFNRFHENLYFPASFHVWLIGDALSDILIAGSMLYFFNHTRKQDYQYAGSILAKLVRLVVETNALTAGVALLSFILFVAFPNADYFICTTLVMGKLYSNTLLVTFNNRIALRRTMERHENSGGGSLNFQRGGPSNGTIRIDRFGVSNVETIEIAVCESKQVRVEHV